MHRAFDEEPIVALSTPKGSGAIALIRICGQGAIQIVDLCSSLSSTKKLQDCSTHTIHHGAILENDHKRSKIDEVMFLLMRAPKTFTGQDTVEITCHNNQLIIEKIIQTLISKGARPAKSGEFTKRALIEGKIDLLQAEGINELINANTQIALNNAISQLEGSLSYYFKEIENLILDIIVHAEASFEFLDEEQRDLDFDELVRSKFFNLNQKIEDLSKNSSIQKQIREGVKIALVGSVNAGKSTLFNALLKKERAIVSPIAGTTRDTIEGSIFKNGIFWTFIDTAGIRTTDNLIEKEGIDRSFFEAASADLILLIIDLTKETTSSELNLYNELLGKYNNKTLIVLNKIDAINNSFIDFESIKQYKSEFIKVSSKNKLGMSELEEAIENRIKKLFSNLDSTFLLNERQIRSLGAIDSNLKKIGNMLNNKIDYELITLHLNETLMLLGEFTGKTLHEKMMDNIFSGFCVGK